MKTSAVLVCLAALVACAVAQYKIELYLASGGPCPTGQVCCDTKQLTIKKADADTCVPGEDDFGNVLYFSVNPETNTTVSSFVAVDSSDQCDTISKTCSDVPFDGSCFECGPYFYKVTSASATTTVSAFVVGVATVAAMLV
eukprot:m.356245 g.356245  ORF g.356245 m.356245 type:complete len:141 (-) comp17483_c0_seq1:152-574(-)